MNAVWSTVTGSHLPRSSPLPRLVWERKGARGDGEGGQLRFGLGWFQLTTYKGQAGHQLTQRLFNDRQIVVR